VSARALAAAPRPADAAAVDALFQLRRRLAGPHLPQGAPTSPALANLCAYGLDVRLSALARSLGATYSRYADDLTFSADGVLGDGFARMVAGIVRDEGFVLNPAKTRVMLDGGRQAVTGIVVNRRLNVSRAECDALKATLHNCARSGPASQARGIAHFREHLRGRVAWVTQVHPARGAKLARLFAAINWETG
jgi:RNA-directed DNA polymerase